MGIGGQGKITRQIKICWERWRRSVGRQRQRGVNLQAGIHGGSVGATSNGKVDGVSRDERQSVCVASGGVGREKLTKQFLTILQHMKIGIPRTSTVKERTNC